MLLALFKIYLVTQIECDHDRMLRADLFKYFQFNMFEFVGRLRRHDHVVMFAKCDNKSVMLV